MGEGGVAEGRVGQVAQHGYLDHRHDLAPFYPEHRAAQDLAGLGGDHSLHEAARLTRLYSPRNVGHWELGYEHVAALVPCLLLAEPDPAQLGVYEHGVGDLATGDGGAPTLQQVGADDAEIVVGDVREGRPSLHISQSPHALRAGLQALVDLDLATPVRFYA